MPLSPNSNRINEDRNIYFNSREINYYDADLKQLREKSATLEALEEVNDKLYSLDKYFALPSCTKKINLESNITLDYNLEKDTSFAETTNNNLPRELSHIADAIKESQYIISLKENWDSEGALKIEP